MNDLSDDRETFDRWMISMDSKLDQLFRELPSNVAAALDYTPESLGVLEKWMISTYASIEDMSKQDRDLLDRLACYVGETIRKNTAAKWTVELSNSQAIFYGLPIMKATNRATECPLSLVGAALDRRVGTMMESILRSML